MDKEQLIKFAEELYQEAFAANAYFLIMQQYREMQKEYLAEMRLSPAFYSVIYGRVSLIQKGRTVKIIAGYHQYFAVRKAVERTRNALEEHWKSRGYK